jgi:hypothetical protein
VFVGGDGALRWSAFQNAYSLLERIAVVEAYVRTKSIKETRAVFVDKFPNARIPAKSTVQDLVAIWCATGSVPIVQLLGRPSVTSAEVVSDAEQKTTASPKKSSPNF